ncbi:hypothetical protein LTR85_007858 [Meristemomyces frigidus]|nr:hypothetical protein LTR85_007858 [Meristemomyces frigidus]
MLLFEPILGSSQRDSTYEGLFYAHLTVQKADTWTSRAAAAKHFKCTAPYKGWDARVLEAWMRHGITSTSSMTSNDRIQGRNESVTLTTDKHQEAVTYVRPSPNADVTDDSSSNPTIVRIQRPRDLDDRLSRLSHFYCPASSITFNRLPELRPPVMFVWGGKSAIAPACKQQEILAMTGSGVGGSGGVTDHKVFAKILPEGGHLLPLDRPSQCAEVAYEFFCQALHNATAQECNSTGLSFGKGSREVSTKWKTQAKREVDAMLVSKVKL